MNPLRFALLCLAGKRPRFADDQRRRLVAKAKGIKFSRLRQISTIVTPQTLLARHRRLIARKYDSSRAEQ